MFEGGACLRGGPAGTDNLIDRRLALCRPTVGRAWSNYSRSSVRSSGPLDGRPNPRGARVSRGHGQNSVHRNVEDAQPTVVRWPRGTGINAGLRIPRRRGRAPAPQSGFHVARGASATCAFVGRSSRSEASQSVGSAFDGGEYSNFRCLSGLPSTVGQRRLSAPPLPTRLCFRRLSETLCSLRKGHPPCSPQLVVRKYSPLGEGSILWIKISSIEHCT